GVTNYVVAPVALNGRRKTDKLDARALVEKLDRFVRGHTRAFSPVKVPTPEQEQDRALVRHRQALVKSLARCAQQGRSQLLLQGLRVRGACGASAAGSSCNRRCRPGWRHCWPTTRRRRSFCTRKSWRWTRRSRN